MTAEDEAFLQQILEEQDRLFRETSRLKGQLAGFENFESERVSYQQQIRQKDQTITQKDQTINQKDQTINQLDQTINNLDQTINNLDQTINKLKRQVEMLLRKIWGKSSERYVNEDPQQRRLDFEGLDLLPEEEELATSAKQEIEQYKTISVPVKAKPIPCANPCRKVFQGKNVIFIRSILTLKSGRSWSRRSPKYWNATQPDGMYAGSSVTNMY